MTEIGAISGAVISRVAGGMLQATPVATTEGKISSVYGAPHVNGVSRREVQPSVPGMDDELRKREEKSKAARETYWQREQAFQSRRMDEILFAYNFRGDLRIKYMDSLNELIYQTPPVLFAKISDLMATTTPVDLTV